MPLVTGTQRYYPQQRDPRLNEDLRIAYDHIYTMQNHLSNLSSQLQTAHKGLRDAHAKLDGMARKLEPGGPSSTKIAGLNVEGIPPASGKAVTNLSGLPVLTYDKATGQITWKIPA